MERNSIYYIKEVAKKVKNSGLKRLSAAQTKAAIEGVMHTVGLHSMEEAILFCAYFDKTCQGRSMDFEDVSNYFGCSTLDLMEMIPSVKTLLNKGYLTRSHGLGNSIQANITRISLLVEDSVFLSVIGNSPVVLKPTFDWETIKLDRYEFCAAIGKMVEAEDVETGQIVKQTISLENANLHHSFITTLRNTVSEVTDRALFYDLAYDNYRTEGKGKSNIERTLHNVYTNFSKYILAKKDILEKSHILVTEGLIEKCSEKEMRLTPKGCELFFGEDMKFFMRNHICDDIYAFLNMIREFFNDDGQFCTNNDMDYLPRILEDLESGNEQIEQLGMVKKMLCNAADRAMFYYIGANFINNRSTQMSDMVRIFNCGGLHKTYEKFKNGKTIMQCRGYVELAKTNSMVGPKTTLRLTDKGAEVLLGEDAQMFMEEIDEEELITTDKIVGKKLFFSEKLENQLSLIRDSLQEKTYQYLRNRLEEQSLPKGVAVLFYGEPGTGKTESVMQIAKETNRPVMHVDISNTKSMWFGESEKIIKKVFADYRRLCERSKVKPILLFNEADAIFSKRKDVNHSNVAQTENAMQNIILEEVENLDGILVATTNLADNLDKAFERRFLFKVRFDKPTTSAKKSIWKNKLPRLTDDETLSLSTRYDFSGGQIDNIVRKCLMQEIVKGEATTLDNLYVLCDEEVINKRNFAKIGFC